MSAIPGRRPYVLKLGGEVVRDAPGLTSLAHDLAELHAQGTPFVLVHGGGPQTTEIMGRLGLQPIFVGGRRVTDDATLEVVKLAISGQVSTDLVASLVSSGLPALGLSGVSAAIVQATLRPPRKVAGGGEDAVDFGRVGDVAEINAHRLEALLGQGFLPVLACLAITAQGEVLNINADVVAVDVASALGAAALITVANVPGVLSDPEDLSSRIPRLSPNHAQQLMAKGTIGGGMCAKLEEAFRALHRGVPRVVITGPPAPGILMDAVHGTNRRGTQIVPDPRPEDEGTT